MHRLERVAHAVVGRRPVAAAAEEELSLQAPPGCVPAPIRTTSLPQARALVQRHGISIYQSEHYLSGTELPEAAIREFAATMPRAIWGSDLAQHKMPERIAGGGWDGQRWRGHKVSGPDRGHIPNAAHMDTPPFGDIKSDYFLMCCAEVPDSEGYSYMLDGYDILEKLPKHIREAMWNIPTQSSGGRQSAGGLPLWRSTNAKRTARGGARVLLRGPNGGNTTNQHDIDEPTPEHYEEGAELINAWRCVDQYL